MNAAAWNCFWAWFLTLHRRQRMLLHAFWASQLAMVLLVLLAPHAFAAGMDAVVGFTGIHDSYGVPLVNNRFINGDDSLFDWNGVLPRIHAGTSISTGIVNAIGEAETAFIVVTVALFLWFIRVLRSVFWNHLIGGIFSSVGLSLNALLNSTPVLYIGMLVGTFAGVLAMGVGRYTAGRMTIGTTWALGIVGVSLGRNVLTEMLAPAGWIDQIRVVSEGAAGVMMRQGRDVGAGASPLDGQSNKLETGFADATRQALQDWMLGRVVDPQTGGGSGRPGTNLACSQAWTAGQKSGNPMILAQQMAGSPSDGVSPACPNDVLMHIQHVNLFNGVFIWLLLMGCLAVGAWFAWCGLNCRFRFIAHGAFALGYLVYGLFPGFPRRFLKLASADLVVQGLSDGIYTILTGLYVMVLLAAWTVAGRIPLIGEMVINRLVITAITMVLLTGYVAHVRKIHRMATQLPAAGNMSPGKLAAPVTMAATAGLSAAAASRGGRFAATGGGRSGGAGGGGVNNKATSARINAGLQAAQIALSRLHPAAAAAGAVAGGFGSAAAGAFGQKKAGDAEKKESGGKSPASVAPPAPAGRGPSGPAGTSPATGGQRSHDHVQRARQRASTARSDASSVAAQTALKRPGGPSRPVRGSGSGFFQ